MRAFVLLGFVSALGAGCGGRIIADEDVTLTDAGAGAPEAEPPRKPPVGLDSGPPVIPDSPSTPSTIAVDTTGCVARPWASPAGGGYATAIVDAWIHALIEECGVPTTCGVLTVHFSRAPNPACVDTLTFSDTPPAAFIACLVKAVSRERLTAGNFVDGDKHTVRVCGG